MVISIDQLLDEEIAEERRALKALAGQAVSQGKRIRAAIQCGDLRGLELALEQIQKFFPQQTALYHGLASKVGQFDYRQYSRERFPQEFLEACRAEGIMVEGVFPTYEVFPFLVQIDVEGRCALINGRRVVALRPGILVQEVKREHQALCQEPFDAPAFLKAISAVYDLLVLQRAKEGLSPGDPAVEGGGEMPVPIKQVYAALTPLRRLAREYPQRFFAFDLHRLLRSGCHEVDGRRWELGFSRRVEHALRIVDESGEERFIASLLFRRHAAGG